MFSLEQLLFAIANDQRSKDETVTKILPMLLEVFEAEKADRQALKVNEKDNQLTHRVLKLSFILGCWCDSDGEDSRN